LIHSDELGLRAGAGHLRIETAYPAAHFASELRPRMPVPKSSRVTWPGAEPRLTPALACRCSSIY